MSLPSEVRNPCLNVNCKNYSDWFWVANIVGFNPRFIKREEMSNATYLKIAITCLSCTHFITMDNYKVSLEVAIQ